MATANGGEGKGSGIGLVCTGYTQTSPAHWKMLTSGNFQQAKAGMG